MSKDVRKYASLFLIREVQVKTTIRPHLMLMRMTHGEKTSGRCQRGYMQRKRNPVYTIGGNVD